ncbi:MAG: hypothetical protein IAG13_03810, partial [Deltaproteobacteria bacterium]|nr:hypothetical protein [Nannocystaceae bacterium]
MDLGEARAGMVVAHEAAPVLVLSDSPRPFAIVRVKDAVTGEWVQRKEYLGIESTSVACQEPPADGDDTSAECFDALAAASTVLLTGNGRYIVAIDRTAHAWMAWSVDATGKLVDEANQGLDVNSPMWLLTSLRDSGTVIARDAHQRLLAVPDPRFPGTVEPLAEDLELDLKLVAVGNRHVVGREV